MERRRWYKLGIKEKKAAKEIKDSKKAKSGYTEKEGGTADESDEQNEEYDLDDEEADDRIILSQTGEKLDSREALKNDLFGYIDENGTVVYINIEDDLDFSEQEKDASCEVTGDNNVEEKERALENGRKLEISEDELPQNVTIDMQLHSELPGLKAESMDILKDPQSTSQPKTEEEKHSFFCRYFTEQRQPCPRINPCLMIRLILYCFSFFFT
jgi:hypothetical protein